MLSKFYSEAYFNNLNKATVDAARIILKDLNRIYKFKTLIDIGCGHGSWLLAASEINSIKKITGVDGIYSKKLHQNFKTNSKINFIYQDLEKKILIKVDKYDLAISLETAEHFKSSKSQRLCKRYL